MTDEHSFEKPLFTPTRLEEERTDDIVKVRLNKADRADFDAWKVLIGESKESGAFKSAVRLALNVAQTESWRLIRDYIKKEAELRGSKF